MSRSADLRPPVFLNLCNLRNLRIVLRPDLRRQRLVASFLSMPDSFPQIASSLASIAREFYASRLVGWHQWKPKCRGRT